MQIWDIRVSDIMFMLYKLLFVKHACNFHITRGSNILISNNYKSWFMLKTSSQSKG